MGSISPCFEPQTAILLEKWAAFRPAPNLKIQRRLAYKNPWKNWETLPPFAKPNKCRSHTWYEKKAAFCPPEPLNSKFALLQQFSWEKVVQHFAQFWNSKFKIALLQPFSCEKLGSILPCFEPMFLKIALLQNFLGQNMGSISPCFEPRAPKTALPQQMLLEKNWAAIRPALSPNFQKSHCRKNSCWKTFWHDLALFWVWIFKVRIAENISWKRSSSSLSPKVESSHGWHVSGQKNGAAFRPFLSPQIEKKNRMAEKEMNIGKHGQHFAVFWVWRFKVRIATKISWKNQETCWGPKLKIILTKIKQHFEPPKNWKFALLKNLGEFLGSMLPHPSPPQKNP